MTLARQEAELCGARLPRVWLLPSHGLFGKALAVSERQPSGGLGVSHFWFYSAR